jgi:NDP-sugar pyrophosphorylase family protein
MNIPTDTKTMDVVILCGGFGKRLRSLVQDRPKSLVEINGRVFLDILIEYVQQFGFRRFILCIGYLKTMIKEHFRSKKNNLEIIFSEEKQLLGTGGAIKNAELLIKSSPFLVMNGDSLCTINLHEFINFHTSKQSTLSLVLTKTKAKTAEYGTAILNNTSAIVSFNEKSKFQTDPCLVNAGIYLMEKIILSQIPQNKNYSLEYDLFPKMTKQKFYGYATDEILIDIGSPYHYKAVQKILKSRGGKC